MEANQNKQKKAKAPVYPANIEAEKYLLCCMLLDGNAAAVLIDKLKDADFYSVKHQKILSAMREIKSESADGLIDFLTVSDQMSRNGSADATTLEYLSELVDLLPSGANFDHYYSIVRRDSVLREIINANNEILERAYSSEAEDEKEVLNFAEKKIFELSEHGRVGGLTHIYKSVTELVERLRDLGKNAGTLSGLQTGFPIFDNITNGLQKGNLIVLAARPGVGKTAFALNIVANIIKSGKQKAVAVFSLEMAAMELSQRLVSNLSGVTMDALGKGELPKSGEQKLISTVKRLADTKIFMSDASFITPMEILSECRRICRGKEGVTQLDLIIVDYLQLMSSGNANSDKSRQQTVADISRLMKLMAKELKCPVLLLSQMSRSIETRDDKTPQLSDLRESGAIEQDADIVMFLTKEIDDGQKDSLSPIMLIVAKNRHGKTANIRLTWHGEVQNFTQSDDQSGFFGVKVMKKPPNKQAAEALNENDKMTNDE